MHIQLKATSHARLQALPLGSTSLSHGFWAEKQIVNRQCSLMHGYNMLEDSGNFDNLRLAAESNTKGAYRGLVFMDSDVYKWLEAAAVELGRAPYPELEKKVDAAIALLESAQQPDGYLNSYYQTAKSGERWTDLDHGHELYCAGHLFEAAVTHQRATGKDNLMRIALRFADHIEAVFGPGKRQAACGHPEVELALVEVYRQTGERRYLDLAEFFISQRGRGQMRGYGQWGPEYHQDRVPVREAKIVEGHAVRQLYLTAGATDLYLETGDFALLESMLRLWDDLAAHKTYLTGGFGARNSGESFGDAYELPNQQAYCETCAAIAGMMWNWRMLLATGEARFADLLERSLYNGFLSGWSLDGSRFFYVNPLQSPGGTVRQTWYECACCPPNVMRTIALLDHYAASGDANGIQIHLYMAGRVQLPGRSLQIETDYPWDGRVQIRVDQTNGANWSMALRIPAWGSGAILQVNGMPQAGELPAGRYFTLRRTWQIGDVVTLELPMQPHLVEAHPMVSDLRGMRAIERGPLVYCLEEADQPAGLEMAQIAFPPHTSLAAHKRADLLGGVVVVEGQALKVELEPWQGKLYRRVECGQPERVPVNFTAIPYFAWANRGTGKMRVWLPSDLN